MSRIFKVWVNLDEMCARLDVYSDLEVAQWVRGFRIGSRGGIGTGIASAPMLNGLEFGQQAHEEAIAYSARQAAKGRLRHQPKPCHGSATAEPRLSTGSANPASNIQHLASNSEHPQTRTHSQEANAFDTGPVEVVTPEERWRYERQQEWATALLAVGAKVGPGNWQRWQGLVSTFGLVRVGEAAKALDADSRWDDKTEMALKAQGSQVPIGVAVKKKIIRITQ